jgi:hypothetical protein
MQKAVVIDEQHVTITPAVLMQNLIVGVNQFANRVVVEQPASAPMNAV